jgi:acyl-CoA synthetase (NDP forming)
MASVGNQVDVSLEEILDYFIDEGESRVLTAFIEGIGSPDQYIRMLIKARERSIPLILVKSGTSDIGSRTAATHTASIASSGRVFTEISRQYGAVLVESPAAMLDLALVAETIGKPRGGRIAVLSQSGGAASLTADLISRRPALSLPGLPPRLIEEIGRMEGIPGYADLMNPLDARGDVMRGESIAELISLTADSEAFDLMFLLFAKNPNREIEEETARGIIAGRDRSPLPLVVIWMGEGEGGTGASGAFSLLREAKIPLFYDPAPAVSACAALLESWNEN